MATTTTNLGLIEPAGQDRALVANINTNSEKIDAEAGKARANFALVQNGDTATQAISQGQLVVWKGALKKATANIASGATLSSSNLTDDSIASEIASLNSNIAKLSISSRTQFTSPVGTVDTTLSGYLRIGSVVYVFGVIATTSQINQNDIVISGIPAAEVNNTVVTIYDNTGGTAFNLIVNNAGNALLQTAIQINTQHSLRICFTYICRD